MRTVSGVFRRREIWMAVAVAMAGLWVLFGAIAFSSYESPVPPTPKCLSLASEPRLSSRPEGWVLDFDLLVTGTLPSVPITPTVVGSWTSEPLKVLTRTYSAPSALRLIFDIDASMLTPTTADRIAQEEQFWNRTLGEVFDAGNVSSPLWSSLNVFSYFECHSKSPNLRWYWDDLSVTPDIVHSQVYEAFECASNNANSTLSPFSYNAVLGGATQSPPRTWISIRWLPSDSQFLSGIGSLDDFEKAIKSRYDYLGMPLGDQLIILVPQRTYGASLSELESRERLRQRIQQLDPAHLEMYFLSVDKSSDDPSLINEIENIKKRLQLRNVVHLSVLVDNLLTADQARSAYLLIDYRASSSQCDFLQAVPLPTSWLGGENPKPPFPLDWLRLIVASCFVVSLAMACSLFLYGRHQWFRERLRKTEWERKWDSPDH